MSAVLVTGGPYARILSRFPNKFTFCFAYGSGVKQQTNNRMSGNMIDLVYCVDDAKAWHGANMEMNPNDYSGLRYFGHNFIAKFQENSGAKVYFNTLVPIDEFVIKYGVISTKDIITDLLEWSDLYLAGRLHKPVEFVLKPQDPELETALELNLKSAVHAAMLILPEAFSEYEFYHTISNLSYAGDFRMMFGENKNKVQNIVKPQLEGFRRLYKPLLLNLTDYVDFPMLKEDIEHVTCTQDIHPLTRLHHLNQLPRWPQKALTRVWNKGNFRQDTEDVLRAIAYDSDCSSIVEQCIGQIVWKSSIGQSLKSLVTAGVIKSVKYSSRKIVKMFK